MRIEIPVENRQRIFIDMDGTLAEWRNIKIEVPCEEDASTKYLERQLDQILYKKNYFSSLQPNTNFLNAVSELLNDSRVDIYVLSCVLPDKEGISPVLQKNRWLDGYLPKLDSDHRIFVPNGKDKKDYIPGGIKESDVLIDDYTKNLDLWEEKGRGLKFLNGVNATKGTWSGSMISYEESSKKLKADVLDFSLFNKEIKHGYPEKVGTITDKDFLQIELL